MHFVKITLANCGRQTLKDILGVGEQDSRSLPGEQSVVWSRGMMIEMDRSTT